MARAAHLLLALTLIGAAATPTRSQAQTADSAPASAAPATDTAEPEFLRTLPRPPDQPPSLFAPPPPPGPPPLDLEKPYFQCDPLLDPPQAGQPGWFGDVEVGILKPHLKNQLSNSVTFADGSSTLVGVNASRLNWTGSPRFEVGYRLPSGFGGISLAYRFLVSQGSESVIGTDGPATLRSRLDFNLVDLDWSSWEFSLWPRWDMRVHLGLRYVSTYFDSRADESFAEASAGTGIFNTRTTSSYWGIGPHARLDLRRRLGFGGLSVVGQLDLSSAIGRIRQNFFASSTSLGADGLPQSGRTILASSQAMPIVNARAGLSWQPPALPNLRVFAGYQFEYVWHAGELTILPDTGDFWDSGAVLRAEFNY